MTVASTEASFQRVWLGRVHPEERQGGTFGIRPYIEACEKEKMKEKTDDQISLRYRVGYVFVGL